MDKSVKPTLTLYQKLYDFVKSGKSSSLNHDSCVTPFFGKDIISGEIINFETEEVNKKLNDLKIPLILRIIYQIIGTSNREIYFNNWTLLSLDKALDIYKNYKIHKQEFIYDFAVRYVGMGHIIVACINLKDGGLLYRSDGGANGYEREDNFKFLIEYIPKSSDKTINDWIEETKIKEKGPFDYDLINR